MGANDLAEPPFRLIALHRSPELPSDDHTHPPERRLFVVANAQERQRSSGESPAAVKNHPDLGAARDPPHPSRTADYTVRRFLPLARRRLSTRRPSVVDIRFRNPCVRLRRNLLGCLVVTDIDVDPRACYFQKNALL